MSGELRRRKILEYIRSSTSPVSGSELASRLGVSRQVIVQDLALIRAENKNIISTHKGYLLPTSERVPASRVVKVRHTTKQIGDELNTIVDSGGKVLNVVVDHNVYGKISADLKISSRKDVGEFVARLEENQTRPLKELTGGAHYHTIVAESEEILDYIEAQLRKKGYLIDE